MNGFRKVLPQHQVSIADTTRLGKNLNLLVMVTRSLSGNSTQVNQVFVGLSYFFGHETVGTISARQLERPFRHRLSAKNHYHLAMAMGTCCRPAKVIRNGRRLFPVSERLRAL
jgi:hypothetical protein